MQTYFALLSLFGLLTGHQGTSFLLDKQCGHLNSARVVNGVNAGEKYAVWMAAIRNKSGFLCGGTLIHKRFVLTAAHCIDGQENLSVKLGVYRKSDPAPEYNVTRAVVHRLYNINHQHDIGLLKLSRSVVYSATVRPICIILNKETQQRLEYTAEQKFKAFGWGTTSDRLESEILQSITVDILDPTVCERNLLYTPVSEQICVGNPEGDTCRGDSGGPLSITVTINELFREVQHGIISVGARDCNNTSVLTRVSSYVDWIQGAINMNEDVNELPLRFESDVDEDKWLYKDCGGDTISSNLRAKITGRFFMAKGVLITNRFVLANARDLREPASSLKVDVMGKETSFGEYGVNLVLKHSNNEDDIALLRLNTLVTYTDHMKPICMLANSQLQQTGSLLSPFTVFDYVGTKGAVSVNTIDSSECSWNVQRSVGKDDVCVRIPTEMSKNFGKGEILGKVVMDSGKERFVLFGIVSYIYNGWHVITNVTSLTEWIASTVQFHQ